MNKIEHLQKTITEILGKEIAQATNEEIYDALLVMVQKMAAEKEHTESKKKLYYISAEFLIGKLLSNNMINLDIYKEVKEILEENGKNLAEIEEVEPEPSLGNGGLAGWQPASWILSLPWDFPATASDLTIIWDFSSRNLTIIFKKRCRIRGSKKSPG